MVDRVRGNASGYITEKCWQTGKTREQTGLLLVAGQRWLGQAFREFFFLKELQYQTRKWGRRIKLDTVRAACEETSTSWIYKTFFFF